MTNRDLGFGYLLVCHLTFRTPSDSDYERFVSEITWQMGEWHR